MQIRSLLTTAIRELKQISDTAQLDAEILLAHILGLTRTQLLIRLDESISATQEKNFQELLQRRNSGEPIAYIIGHREFWSLNLIVTPATLIPRPETEQLVEIALQKFSADERIRIVDLGTGTGAIALALAYERPNWEVIATDRSVEALTVAKLNAERLQLKNISFRQGNWCDALQHDEKFQLIISNPPYIAKDDPYLQQHVIAFEPQTALIANKHGFEDLHSIIEQAPNYLLSEGWLILEHGYQQKKVLNEFLSVHGYVNIENHMDFSDVFRICAAQFDFVLSKK
jgi:release factor glutamine methyltransferase